MHLDKVPTLKNQNKWKLIELPTARKGWETLVIAFPFKWVKCNSGENESKINYLMN